MKGGSGGEQAGRKAQLLREKILTSAAITHNTYQYRIDQLGRDQEELEGKLEAALKELDARVMAMGRKYQEDMAKLSLYYSSGAGSEGETSSLCRELIQADQVRAYLNSEKGLLKQVLEGKPASQPNERGRIHELVRKKQLAELLEGIQVQQLEREIKYLSTHVINSSGLIYVPDQTMTDVQEDHLNSRVALLLGELERLVGLEVVCSAGTQGSTQPDVLAVLDEQDRRLDKVIALLSAEKAAAQAIERGLDQHIEQIRAFPIHYTPWGREEGGHSKPMLMAPTRSQLECILDGVGQGLQGEVVSSQTCQHEELNSNLKQLRNKLKKLE